MVWRILAYTNSVMISIRIWAWVISLAAFGCGVATLWLSAPSDLNPAIFHGNTAASVIFMVLSLGAAGLFLGGLHGFSRRLKIAYGIMCAGFGLTGLASVQIPIMNILSLQDTVWAKGLIAAPFILAAWLIYYGVRQFARLFEVSKFWSSGILAQVVAIIAAAATVTLPHAPWNQPEVFFDASVAITTFTSVQVQFAVLLAFLVAWRTGQVYRRPMRLLAWALLLVVIGTIVQVGAAFVITNGIERVSGGIAIIPQVMGMLILVRAAVAFNSVSEPLRQRVVVDDLATGRLAVDVVVYVAGLVSNPQNIDSALEAVRSLTARLTPNSHISMADEQKLAKSYLEIEHYLAKNEPVRRYSATELRVQTETVFGESLLRSQFWRSVQLVKPVS